MRAPLPAILAVLPLLAGCGGAPAPRAPEPQPEPTPAVSRPAMPTPPPAPPQPARLLSDAEAASLFADAVSRGLPQTDLLLVVDAARGRAELVCSEGFVAEWPVSTAKAGVGAEAGSNKTPPGWHRAVERIGRGAAPGTMFVSRRPNGRVLPPSAWRAPDPAEDAILTRVVWLAGLEPGVNAGRGIDSHERCIYLHGTNQEQLLGSPASHGCIRFSNAAIEELFDLADGVEMYCLVR